MRAITLTASLLLVGCASGPMTDQERDSSDRTLRALEILNAGVNGRRAAPVATPAITAFLKSQYVSGQNRICVYDRLGSQYVITIAATQLCPLNQ